MVQQHRKITVEDHHLQPHGTRHQVGPSLTSVHPKEPKQHQLVGQSDQLVVNECIQRLLVWEGCGEVSGEFGGGLRAQASLSGTSASR